MERWLIRLFIPLAIATAIPALAADVSFFEPEGFRGRSFTANQTIPNRLGNPTWQFDRQR